LWSALTSHKLDKLKLDDAQQTITAWLEEGREIVDREAAASSSGGGGGTVGVDGVLGIGANAFGEEGERWVEGVLASASVMESQGGQLLMILDLRLGVYPLLGCSRISTRLRSSGQQTRRRTSSTRSSIRCVVAHYTS
jgi:ubiquitin-like modifier-activating enzyme ATG7